MAEKISQKQRDYDRFAAAVERTAKPSEAVDAEKERRLVNPSREKKRVRKRDPAGNIPPEVWRTMRDMAIQDERARLDPAGATAIVRRISALAQRAIGLEGDPAVRPGLEAIAHLAADLELLQAPATGLPHRGDTMGRHKAALFALRHAQSAPAKALQVALVLEEAGALSNEAEAATYVWSRLRDLFAVTAHQAEIAATIAEFRLPRHAGRGAPVKGARTSSATSRAKALAALLECLGERPRDAGDLRRVLDAARKELEERIDRLTRKRPE